jgi:mono/diheme cytochrome c family protein
MRASKIAAAILGAMVICDAGSFAYPAEKQAPAKFDLGKREYDSKCAVCHGRTGMGDGPYTGLLDTKIPDLTTLAQRNHGMFPVLWVQEVIDGRQSFKAHGPSEMPIWGLDYLAKSREFYTDPYDTETYIRTRILALTEYIYRLQAK